MEKMGKGVRGGLQGTVATRVTRLVVVMGFLFGIFFANAWYLYSYIDDKK